MFSRSLIRFLIVGILVFAGSVTDIMSILSSRAEAAGDSAKPDWLLDASPYKTSVLGEKGDKEIVLSNGLISRTFRLAPNAATVGFENLITGESVLRAVNPEAVVTLNGVECKVGGLYGQPNRAYLLPEWVDALTNDPDAFQFDGFEAGPTQPTMKWKRVRYSADLPWPPPGKRLTLHFRADRALAARLEGKAVIDSVVGRKALFQEDFEKLDSDWKVFVSKAMEQATFQKEGKWGHIRAGANMSAFAERPLPEGTRLIECLVEPLTDSSASWGPGLTVTWSNGQVIKFHLRPGEGQFGVAENGRERKTGEADKGKAYRLRLRQEGALVYCEAARVGGGWERVHEARLAKADLEPKTLRVGKTDRKGGKSDYPGTPGDDLQICIVSDVRVFGAREEDSSRVASGLDRVRVSVHYEMYDGVPLLSKWVTVKNGSEKEVMLNKFVSERLSAVEMSSAVEGFKTPYPTPNIQAFSEYAFHGMSQAIAENGTRWVTEPAYTSQVNYRLESRCMLESTPLVGPAKMIAPGETFETYRTYELINDSTDRERKGLAMRRAVRTIAPWVTENPILMHVRSAKPDAVRLAIDQCAEVGFEMVILTFGSGFSMENEDPAYLAQLKELADYAHSKKIEIGGYSLLASRRVRPDSENCINIETGKPGGGCFGFAPALAGKWGQDYFRKIYQFFEKTGMDILEHDGSYPGDFDAAARPPLQRGYEDSQWTQWKIITDYYKWCRARGVYLNVPDYYFLSGSNKTGMGYREVNWSLPRAQQVIHARQNIFDGTWEKAPSMGWMFVPLVQYHGGGAAATMEPLKDHLDVYAQQLANNFGAGVQACYRGPRLYDTDETKAVVKKWVDFYKTHRAILDSDIVHLRRADGRDIDYFLHVNPSLPEKGLLMVHNPLKRKVVKTISVPLYYTGLSSKVSVSKEGGAARDFMLKRDYAIDLPVEVEAEGMSWYVIR